MARKPYEIAQAIGASDHVDSDGNVVRDSVQVAVMVRSESDLTLLSDYPPATIAYTAGFSAMWQLGADGDWVSIG